MPFRWIAWRSIRKKLKSRTRKDVNGNGYPGSEALEPELRQVSRGERAVRKRRRGSGKVVGARRQRLRPLCCGGASRATAAAALRALLHNELFFEAARQVASVRAVDIQYYLERNRATPDIELMVEQARVRVGKNTALVCPVSRVMSSVQDTRCARMHALVKDGHKDSPLCTYGGRGASALIGQPLTFLIEERASREQKPICKTRWRTLLTSIHMRASEAGMKSEH